MNELLLRRRVAASKSLPYDAEIEYLESTGTQYIKTGVQVNQNLKTEVTFQFTDVSGNYGIFGLRWAVNNRRFLAMIIKQKLLVQIGNSGQYNFGYINTNIHTLKTQDGKASLDDGDYYNALATWSDVTTAMYLFAINTTATNTPGVYGKVRIYNFKVENIRDMIPVRVGNVGYMYDKISKRLFGNAGTGDFILGPDKQLRT